MAILLLTHIDRFGASTTAKFTSNSGSYPENSLKEDVNTRTIQILQRAGILKVNHCLKAHNVHFQVSIANFDREKLGLLFLNAHFEKLSQAEKRHKKLQN